MSSELSEALERTLEDLLAFPSSFEPVLDIPQKNIESILEDSLEIFKNEPSLLTLEAPINIIGDLFGKFSL